MPCGDDLEILYALAETGFSSQSRGTYPRVGPVVMIALECMLDTPCLSSFPKTCKWRNCILRFIKEMGIDGEGREGRAVCRFRPF